MYFNTCSSSDVKSKDQFSQDTYMCRSATIVSLENRIAVARTPLQKQFSQTMVSTPPKLKVSKSMIEERSPSLCCPRKVMHSSSLTFSPSVAKRRHNNKIFVIDRSHSMSDIAYPPNVSKMLKPENVKQNSDVSSDSSSSRASDKPLEGITSIFILFK